MADKEKKPMSKKKKKKIKTAITWIVIILLLIAAYIAFSMYSAAKMYEKSMVVYKGDIYTVDSRDVANTISATGLIESSKDTTKKVYSTLSYKIDEINVKVGDKISEGDLLCTYETETLDRAIREKELSMGTSERAAALNLSNAKLTYDTYLRGMNDGTNATLKNAQSAYDSALDKYETAKEDYEEYLAKSENLSIIALNSAKRDYDNAKKTYDEFKEEIDGEKNIKLSTAKRALDTAEKTYFDFKEEIEGGTNLKLITAKRSLDTALENYEDYKKLMDDDETTELISASAASDAAYTAYKSAKSALNTMNKALTTLKTELAALEADGTDEEAIKSKKKEISNKKSEIAAQEETVKTLLKKSESADEVYNKAYKAADMNLKTYKTAYENAKDNYDSILESLEDTLENYEKAYKDAKDNYDSVREGLEDTLEGYETSMLKAADAYENAKENADNQLEAYESALTSTERALGDAENALNNAKITADNQLESYRIAYENAKNSAGTALSDYQLSNLYSDLEKTKVTAPISGTVTEVYATEGESISGVMFVIEDLESLVVNSTVKAYDLDKMQVGMKVKIETDATGNDVFLGVLESVSPAAVKDSGGNVLSTNDAEFETVVRVTDKSDRLKIGVSARIEYIVEEEIGVLSIPESAILSDESGDYVLILTDGEEGKVILTRTAVECGMDDGIYKVCNSLEKGTRIVDNAKNYEAKVGLPLGISNVDTSANPFDFMPMMPMGGM